MRPSLIAIEPIPGSMAAAVLEGPRKLTVREIPQWPMASYGDPDMVLVKVGACGVCGSDFRYYAGENPWAQHTLGRSVPNPSNIVLGHEFSGTVVAVSDERNRHLLGKRVAPVCSKVCGACPDCRAGLSHLCPNTVHLGHGQGWGDQEFYPGAYCQYAPAWGAGCYPISDRLSLSEAAMMDILAVCAHVCKVGGVQVGRPVLCIGAGPAGNGIAQTALLLGAVRVVLLDRSSRALSIAQTQGLGKVIDTRKLTDPAAFLLGASPDGFACVFDSVGSAETLELGLKVLGKAGTLVNLAVHGHEPFALDLMRLGSERRLVTSCNFEAGDFPKALSWLEDGRITVKAWLEPVTLHELPRRFEAIVARPEHKDTFKMVVDP